MNVILVAFKPDGARKEFRIKDARCIIGRKPDADLRIPSSTVSRQHTEIVLANATVTVRDLGSSNGTFLNDVRVQEARLSPGDRLAVGPVVFVVQIDGQPAQIDPITSSEMPTATFSDPRSGTRAPAFSPLDESSMVSGAPAIHPDDSGAPAPAPARAAAPARAPGSPAASKAPAPPAPAASDAPDEDAPAKGDDPLSRMISKSKTTEESSVFEFDFFDEEDEEKR